MKMVKVYMRDANLVNVPVENLGSSLTLTLSDGTQLTVDLFESTGAPGLIDIRSVGAMNSRLRVLPGAGNSVSIGGCQ